MKQQTANSKQQTANSKLNLVLIASLFFFNISTSKAQESDYPIYYKNNLEYFSDLLEDEEYEGFFHVKESKDVSPVNYFGLNKSMYGLSADDEMMMFKSNTDNYPKTTIARLQENYQRVLPTQFDVSSLNAGNYLLIIQQGDKVQQNRFEKL
jgi:hypothetical protein